jgi:hypothetical protein
MRNSRKRTRSLQRRTIEDEIALLRDLDLKGLRTHWQNEFDRAAPEHLTRYLLFRILPTASRLIALVIWMPRPLKVLARAARQEDRLSAVSNAELDQRRFSPPPMAEWCRGGPA